MNAWDECRYRLRLAEGFLAEARQDHRLERWRSCVAHAQLSVENSGKAVLALFGVPPKTHDPGAQIDQLLRKKQLTEKVRSALQEILPHLLALGSREHFLTDYGDESQYVSPWDLFDRASAEDALAAAAASLDRASLLLGLCRESTAE